MKNARKMLFGMITLVLLLAACAPAATPAAATAATEAPQPAAAVEQPTEAPAATETVAGPVLKLAAVLPGVVTDADYNTMAYLGTQAVTKDMGIETTYSESVAVPDVDRVMREYIDSGYNVIWTHGGQFVTQTIDLAKEFPDVYFIAEGDAMPDGLPANVWFIDRNFHNGFYGIGALAARATTTGKIGYLGGLTLPFSYAEVHAVQQAIKDSGKNVELIPVWAGDFNDPAKARQVADSMIAEGVDVIIGSLNLGMQGVFESVKANTGSKVLVTAKYSDKSQFAPDNYITSLIYDFSDPLEQILKKIQSGEKGGYYPLGYDTGVKLQTPLQNVPESVRTDMAQVIADLISGKIQVIKDTSEIK